MRAQAEVVVVGGGVVGSAIAYGLARAGIAVLVLDGGRRDFRATAANFGLVWVQGKAAGMPAYQALTRTASDAWPQFAQELERISGLTLAYARPGGLAFCLGAEEFEARALKLRRLHNEGGGERADCEMLERAALERLLPDLRLGDAVTGASYCWRDGHTNPLKLLHALKVAIFRLGGRVIHGATVRAVRPTANGCELATAQGTVAADRLVLAAGLGTKTLAEQAGLTIPVAPQRGQILVTQPEAPILPLPASGLRQTGDGTMMIGSTQEDVGFETGTTPAAAARLAARAVRTFPALKTLRVARQWAGLRVLTPDHCPIYEQSERHPGVFAAVCHSGITLASIHASTLAEAIQNDHVRSNFDDFQGGRFGASRPDTET